MLESEKIINLNEHSESGEPLFFGNENPVFDNVNQRYPVFYSIYEALKEIDWGPRDIILAKGSSRIELAEGDPNKSDLMIKSLTWQLMGDSIIKESDYSLQKPFISNTQYEQLLAYILYNENNHAETYSEIIKQCMPDPNSIYDELINNNHYAEKSKAIIEALEQFKIASANKSMGRYFSVESYYKPSLLDGLVANYCLEAISFMASFAVTFSLGETGYCYDICRLVQKIYIDEIYHVKTREETFKILRADPEFKDFIKKRLDHLDLFIKEVQNSEHEWCDYIFSEGRNILGLNSNILKKYVDHRVSMVRYALGIDDKVMENPLQYMERWADINRIQITPQESELTAYPMNVIVDDLSDDEIVI